MCSRAQFGAAARELQQLDGCSRMAAAGGFAAAGFGGCSMVNQLAMDSSDRATTAYIVVEKRNSHNGDGGELSDRALLFALASAQVQSRVQSPLRVVAVHG